MRRTDLPPLYTPQPDWADPSPLHHAAIFSHGLDDLLERTHLAKRPVDVRDRAGLTPLHWAVRFNQMDAVRWLLTGNGDLFPPGTDLTQVYTGRAAMDAQGQHGETPLHFAFELGHVKMVELLLDFGAQWVRDQQGHNPMQSWEMATPLGFRLQQRYLAMQGHDLMVSEQTPFADLTLLQKLRL